MNGLGRAEAEAADVVTLQDVQHLRDMHAGRRRRRRAEDGPAPIVGTDRLPLNGLVAGEIVAADEPAGLLHVIGEDVAERSAIERGLAVVGDIAQGLGIFGLHDAFAAP